MTIIVAEIQGSQKPDGLTLHFYYILPYNYLDSLARNQKLNEKENQKKKIEYAHFCKL